MDTTSNQRTLLILFFPRREREKQIRILAFGSYFVATSRFFFLLFCSPTLVVLCANIYPNDITLAKRTKWRRNERKNNKIFAFFWFNFNRKLTHTKKVKHMDAAWNEAFTSFSIVRFFSLLRCVWVYECLLSANAHFQSILKLLGKHLSSEKGYEKKRRTNLILSKKKRNDRQHTKAHALNAANSSKMHCTTEILRQWPKDCLCERLSPQRSLLMPLLLLLLLYLNSWISFSVPFVLTMQQLSLRCKFVHFSTHPNRMTTSCGPATIGKLVANSVCAMHKKPVYGCCGYCCYFPRIFISWVLFVPHVHLPLHPLRVPFFCIFCVCFVR